MNLAKNYFKIEELVSKAVFLERGAASIELLDPKSLPLLNALRSILGVPITINDWLWGGVYFSSGLRIAEQFSLYSQHNFGRAFDLKLDGMSVRDAILKIIENHSLLSAISFIEIDRTWLHIDFRKNRGGDDLVLWSPDRGYVTIDTYLAE